MHRSQGLLRVQLEVGTRKGCCNRKSIINAKFIVCQVVFIEFSHHIILCTIDKNLQLFRRVDKEYEYDHNEDKATEV